MLVRDMRDEDFDAVVAIWRASGVARPWNDPATDIAFARRGPHSTVLVGEAEGGIVATAMVGEDGHRGWTYYVAAAEARAGDGRSSCQELPAKDPSLDRTASWHKVEVNRCDATSP
jgi:hypothetical protein